MTWLEEYHDLIRRREVVTGYWIRKEIRNLIEDLDDGRYIYDTTEADKRIRFEEALCLQSKAPYYMKPIKLMPWQKAWWEVVYSFRMADTGLLRFSEALLEIARKNGKALALDTRIPTPDGDKTIREIEPGTYVYGANGEPVKVFTTSKVFVGHKCYKVEFEDGETVVADAGHLWRVKEKLSHGSVVHERTTEEMAWDFVYPRKDGKGKEFKYRVPISGPVQKKDRALPLHPYTLGVWLGDGLSDGTRIACGKEDLEEMIANLEEVGETCRAVEYTGKFLISLVSKGQGRSGKVSKALRALSLKGNKHIPEEYFEASASQRWELLRGLMDTDGTASKAGECEFVQKSERLTAGVSRLLTTLGIKHSVKQKIARCNGKEIPVFRVIFYTSRDASCFKLKRKTERLKENLSSRMNWKSIESITEIESVPTKCLCVEGGLYLCGERNTVTHNSTMFAADGNFDVFVGQGGTSICCASNDDRQAKLIWSEMSGMRRRLDPKKVLTKSTLTEIKNTAKDITVFRLSSKMDNLDGFNITKTFLDESHDIEEENGQSEIAEACWRGMSSQDEPLFLNCTTQGFNRECYLDKKIAYAKQVINGEVDDIHFLAFLYEQDSEQEVWQDESSWEKSNPAIRYGVKKISKLRRDVELAKTDKATRIHLLTKDFNIPQSNAQSWLMLEDYDYKTDPFDLEDFRDSFFLGGVDLSATTDLTSARALFMKPGDNKKYIAAHYWIPESKLESADDKKAGAKYAEWAKDGLLTICEGNENDLAGVADWFFGLYKTYGVKPYKIGYDERFAKTFLDRCEEYGFECEMIRQGRALSNAMKLVEAELKSRSINYNGNPVDKWCLANCCCSVDNYGNIQPVKTPGQPGRRIDGAVTYMIVYEVYRRYKSDFKILVGGE